MQQSRIFDDLLAGFVPEDVPPQDLRHVAGLQRVRPLHGRDRAERLRPGILRVAAFRTRCQIHGITLTDQVCLSCLDLVHQDLPIIADDLQILVRELEQHRLVDGEIDFWNTILVFFIIVQHIADQPFLGLNATRGLPIGCHLQFNARFLKIGSRVAIGLIPKPAFLHNGTDGTFACFDAPSLVDLAQRFADCFLPTSENFRLRFVLPLFHDIFLAKTKFYFSTCSAMY